MIVIVQLLFILTILYANTEFSYDLKHFIGIGISLTNWVFKFIVQSDTTEMSISQEGNHDAYNRWDKVYRIYDLYIK